MRGLVAGLGEPIFDVALHPNGVQLACAFSMFRIFEVCLPVSQDALLSPAELIDCCVFGVCRFSNLSSQAQVNCPVVRVGTRFAAIPLQELRRRQTGPYILLRSVNLIKTLLCLHNMMKRSERNSVFLAMCAFLCRSQPLKVVIDPTGSFIVTSNSDIKVDWE